MANSKATDAINKAKSRAAEKKAAMQAKMDAAKSGAAEKKAAMQAKMDAAKSGAAEKKAAMQAKMDAAKSSAAEKKAALKAKIAAAKPAAGEAPAKTSGSALPSGLDWSALQGLGQKNAANALAKVKPALDNISKLAFPSK